MRRQHATVAACDRATPGEWQCKIRTGGVRQLAVANGPNIFQMLLVFLCKQLVVHELGSRETQISQSADRQYVLTVQPVAVASWPPIADS